MTIHRFDMHRTRVPSSRLVQQTAKTPAVRAERLRHALRRARMHSHADLAQRLQFNWRTIATLAYHIRDNRMSVCIYASPQAQNYVTLWGKVPRRDDASIWPDTRAIVERYVPGPDVEARLQQLRTQNRVIIDFTPERALFRA